MQFIQQRLFGLLALLMCGSVQATSVQGIVNTDTSWLDQSEPYDIAEAVQVAPDVTLTIGHGVYPSDMLTFL